MSIINNIVIVLSFLQTKTKLIMEHAVHSVQIWEIIPFVLMLGAIAVLPLKASYFWESNRNKLIVALILGVPTAIWLLANGMSHEVLHAMVYDYVPFILMLGALFIITGGIYVDGSIESKPATNAIILGIGAVLASLMGTTGAAMLLIRPIISTNANRKYKVHTILFFIAIIANCGGLLTPLGDPPLFMMYLRGVPFLWFAGFIKEWASTNLALIVIFYIIDTHFWKKEDESVKYFNPENKRPVRIHGKLNFVWLLGVVLAVAFINPSTFSFIHAAHPSSFLRELIFVLMAALSMKFTDKLTRENNKFSWEPIEEVAYLFLGIFITMVPALSYLEHHAADLGIDTPMLYYYAAGGLSSFLDNTPTAVTFYSLARGWTDMNPDIVANMDMIANIPSIYMEAICVGAVMFGSMTYIGNGPNFMVKAIAESQGIKMPDFFAYMYKFSLIVLLPLFILIQIIFIHS